MGPTWQIWEPLGGRQAGRQAVIVGVYNKLARTNRVILYSIPIPCAYLSPMFLFLPLCMACPEFIYRFNELLKSIAALI